MAKPTDVPPDSGGGAMNFQHLVEALNQLTQLLQSQEIAEILLFYSFILGLVVGSRK